MMWRRTMVLAGLALVACGGDDEEPKTGCTAESVGAADACEDGLVCAEVQGGEPACFSAVQIEGQVFDSLDGTGIEGATVVALDPNGGAQSPVAVTDADGNYELPVPVVRTADGSPSDLAVTLRVNASGYQSFPTAPRTALPIQISDATLIDPMPAEGEDPPPAAYTVENAATDVALIPLEDQSAQGIIEGSVDFGDAGGILIVAEVGGQAVSTAITDTDGSFKLFNVPEGEVTVSGYRAGVAVEPQAVSATADPVDGVVLLASDAGLATVTGSVSLVNPGDCDETSVILVTESTFVENAARGEAPAGLRAFPVTNEFSIQGVPPGEYVVLAAFENDFCVRDPDPCIDGTEIVHITVPSGGTVEAGAFKITGAMAVRSPGANEIETVTTSEPTFTWEDDSSEDGYTVRVYDALGNVVHENTGVPSANGQDASYTMTGVTLEAGMLYQFRVWSSRRGGECLISSTEDLRGVFLYQP